MQADVQSLKGNETFDVVSKAELKTIKSADMFPMKLVRGTKRAVVAGSEKKNVRAVVCGNFQRKSSGEDLYTANADITSVRAALVAAVPRHWGGRRPRR